MTARMERLYLKLHQQPMTAKELAVMGMLILCRIGMVARADETPSVVPVKTLLSALNSDDFSQRVSAQKSLARQAAENPESLAEAFGDASAEERARLLQLLEGVFLASADEQGDRAERTLMTLADAGASTAEAILIGNARLRESRAREAIERLGAHLTYIHPALSRSAPPITAPGVGIGFGEPALLRVILIPETWIGTLADLWQFERLSHHQNLIMYNIRGSRLSVDDLLPLTAKLVGLQIVIRGACLGIESSPGSTTAEITAVIEKSAAAEAGLQPNDLIEMLNDTKVRNFSHLVELLTEFHPGDKIDLQVRRNGDSLVIPVTLASWKAVLARELQALPAPTPFPGPLGFGSPPPPEKPVPISDSDEMRGRANN